jgi:hypothetical protein
MAQAARKMNESHVNAMKTMNTTFPPLNRPSLPPLSWEGVGRKVHGGNGDWSRYEQGIVKAAIRTGHSVIAGLGVRLLRISLGLARTLGFLVVAVLAVADAIVTRIIAVPTAIGMAHARAAWVHRWSLAARWILGARIERRGVMPPSGIITANYSCFLDVILLAAERPCVFVAGAEVRRWPVLGLLARLGGTLFVDPRRRNDVARVNFLIERAVRRRLLVVIFPECGGAWRDTLRPFASALFQPAVDLGCSLTGAAFTYYSLRNGESSRMRISHEAGTMRQFAQIVSRWQTRVICAFSSPAFHRGNRKQLAAQLRRESLDLLLGMATRVGGLRKGPTETGVSKTVHGAVVAEAEYLERRSEPRTGTPNYRLCCAQ